MSRLPSRLQRFTPASWVLLYMACVACVDATGLPHRYGSYLEASPLVGLFKAEQFEPIYSVMDDKRAESWPLLREYAFDLEKSQSQIIPIRHPLIEIVVCADLSLGSDIEMVGTLLYSSSPSNVYLLPLYVEDGALAGRILSLCFDSIAYSAGNVYDGTRVRDFVKSLVSVVTADKGSVISTKASVFLCRLYTQQFDPVNDWLEKFELSNFTQLGQPARSHRSINIQSISSVLEPGTLVIHDKMYPGRSAKNIYNAIVSSQFEVVRSLLDTAGEL